MIVLDTSALAKLVAVEHESDGLRRALALEYDRGTDLAISSIAVIELRRMAIRLDLAPEVVDPIVRPFRVLKLTEGILALAGRLPSRHLRTLDAIHLATALDAEATDLMTYDMRLAQAAHAEGLRVIAPGADPT